MEQTHPRILLVEDDEASRKLIRAILGKRGYQINEAEDITQARQFLEHGNPAIVLLDIRLKDGSGLDLARYIRSRPRFQSVPILAITAQALKGDENRILEAGCDAYLSKPIDTRRLPQIVDDFIKKGRGFENAG